MDQGGPKVSVIIPTYNRRDLIVETIQSVQGQTMANVEIIVVDDGSSDETGELLRARFGDQVRYFYQENQGRAVARNRGVQEAMGPYLLFLDSDDLLLPEAVASQAAFLDADPNVDVVYSDGYYCDAEGRNIEPISLGRPPVNHENLLETMILTNVIVAIHSAMVRRTALEQLGYPYFDETLRGTEDADMWLRLAAQGACFAYLDIFTCKYRLHSTNASLEGSPSWERRRQSVLRSQYKRLQADFFPTLSAATRRNFFYKLLLYYVKDDAEAQEKILQSPQFRALPVPYQARLFYDVGVDNIVDFRRMAYGQVCLRRAVTLAPQQLQYRLIWYLSQAGGQAMGAVVSLRRKLGQLRQRGKTDYSLAPHGRPGWRP